MLYNPRVHRAKRQEQTAQTQYSLYLLHTEDIRLATLVRVLKTQADQDRVFLSLSHLKNDHWIDLPDSVRVSYVNSFSPRKVHTGTHTQTHHFDLHRRRLWPYLVHWRLSWGHSCCWPSLQHLCVPAPRGVWLSLSALPDETALSVCNYREWVWRHKTTLMTVQF